MLMGSVPQSHHFDGSAYWLYGCVRYPRHKIKPLNHALPFVVSGQQKLVLDDNRHSPWHIRRAGVLRRPAQVPSNSSRGAGRRHDAQTSHQACSSLTGIASQDVSRIREVTPQRPLLGIQNGSEVRRTASTVSDMASLSQSLTRQASGTASFS